MALGFLGRVGRVGVLLLVTSQGTGVGLGPIKPAFAQSAVATPTPPSSDPSALARARYDAGARAFAEGSFTLAALEFEAAASARANAVALYTAGLSWDRANVPDRAADDYLSAFSLGGLPTDRATLARDRLASLEPALGRVAVSAPDGWRVRLDANTEFPSPAVLHGAAGLHTFEARPPLGTVQRFVVTLATGRTATAVLSLSEAQSTVEVQWLNPPAAVLSSPGPDTPRSTLEIHETATTGTSLASLGTTRLLAIALAGGGVLGLVVGTGFGLDALSKRNAAREVCPNTCSSTAGSALWSSAGRSADVSTVTFVLGAAGLAAGTLLWIYSEPPRNSAAPAVHVGFGPGEVEVAGRW